jgi:hypothetical protein
MERALKSACDAKNQPNYWLWVTRPKYYMENGEDRELLKTGGVWTCHKDTKPGDLVLVYRTKPKSDIAYILVSKTDSFPWSSRFPAHRNWEYGCEFECLKAFPDSPLKYTDLQKDPQMEEWNALKAKFFGQAAWRLDPEVWSKTIRRLDHLNPGIAKLIERQGGQIKKHALDELKLEKRLADDPSPLRRLKLGPLSLFADASRGITGRQVLCVPESKRRIDLLFKQRDGRGLIVAELKVVKATRETYGQIRSYVGWVKKTFPHRKVSGVVVSKGYDTAFGDCLKAAPRVIFQIDVKDL